MKIPVLPISYADAQPFLANLEGPVAPEAWRGALPVTYHIGPGPATARLKVDFDSETASALQRDRDDSRIELAGRVGDLWQSSRRLGQRRRTIRSAARSRSLKRRARLAELRKTGWQPKRTIKFALWDAEEFGLIGSTEWVEKHEPELNTKAGRVLQ